MWKINISISVKVPKLGEDGVRVLGRIQKMEMNPQVTLIDLIFLTGTVRQSKGLGDRIFFW